MPPRIVLTDEIAPRLAFEQLIPALAQGFRDFFEGRAKVAPITNIDFGDRNGEMHIKPGYMAGGSHVCVKIATCYYDNPARGLPTRDGLVVLASRANGRIDAILCDAGLITDMRTAGASAVAVDALAPPGPIALGLIGAGTQAYWHALAMPHVRPVEKVVVWGRRRDRVETAVRRIGAEASVPVAPGTLDEAAACDVVVTATPANTPILDRQVLRPGTLVVAMGADAVGKRELGPRILDQATLVVVDSFEQCQRVGELQWLPAAGTYRVVELGAILCGMEDGRRDAEQIVIFDSTGVAFQDVVGALQVLSAMAERASHG